MATERMVEDAKREFEKLFSSDAKKAEAFNKIAKEFYYCNFGSMSKADFETLLFSIYIEQILDSNQDDLNAYSDYTLSKRFGITQSKVSNLKVKKELLYPYEGFDWRSRLAKLSEYAVYENGYIILNLRDKNLLLEVKNAIEENGGYVELQLSGNVLKVRLSWFLDLLISISDGDKEKLRKQVLKELRKQHLEELKDSGFVEKDPISKTVRDLSEDVLIETISGVAGTFAGPAAIVLFNVLKAVKRH